MLRTSQQILIEVVAHIADTEEHALSRIRQMTAENRPYLEPFDQDTLAAQHRYLSNGLATDLARLERLRTAHLAELQSLSDQGWQRTGRHGEHGDLSIELYETHVAAEEEVDHLAEIARLL